MPESDMYVCHYHSTNIKFNKTYSVFSPASSHHQCTLIQCSPFGMVKSCTAEYPSQISAVIEDCQLYIPSLSLQSLCTPTNKVAIGDMIGRHFIPIPCVFCDNFYTESTIQSKQLRTLIMHLSIPPTMQTKVSLCLLSHSTLPSNRSALTMLEGAQLLLQ